MPLSRSTILFSVTILSTLIAPICARPSPHRYESEDTSPNLEPRAPTTTLAQIVLPLSNGSVSLTAPSSPIKAIGLGRGTQNYTCSPASSSTPTPSPIAIGAKATLFDAVPYINNMTASQANALLEQLPRFAVPSTIAQLKAYSPKVTVLGQHIFDAAGHPTFDLTSSGNGVLVAKKVGDILPPIGAPKNAQGNPAVDWLYLTDAGTGASKDLSAVYRVETAGGKQAATCAGYVGPIYLEYAALYFFF